MPTNNINQTSSNIIAQKSTPHSEKQATLASQISAELTHVHNSDSEIKMGAWQSYYNNDIDMIEDQEIKRDFLDISHPGKISYDEPILPFLRMSDSEREYMKGNIAWRDYIKNYPEAWKQNEYNNTDHFANIETEEKKHIKKAMNEISDLAKEYGAICIKQPNQTKGRILSFRKLNIHDSGICFGYTLENILQNSQGKTLNSSMREGKKIKASGINKIIKSQTDFLEEYANLMEKRELVISTLEGKDDDLYNELIKDVEDQLYYLRTGKTNLTQHNFTKINDITYKLENITNRNAREASVLPLINSMTANHNENQKVYKTIFLTNSLESHLISIIVEKQGNTEKFTFSDPNHNRAHIFNDKQNFEGFLREMFLKKDFVEDNEVSVTDFIAKFEQRKAPVSGFLGELTHAHDSDSEIKMGVQGSDQALLQRSAVSLSADDPN